MVDNAGSMPWRLGDRAASRSRKPNPMRGPNQVVDCIDEACVRIKERINVATCPNLTEVRLCEPGAYPGRADVTQRRIDCWVTTFHCESSNIAGICSGSRIRVRDPLHAVFQSSKGNQFVVHAA